jgi:hypothetical protein
VKVFVSKENTDLLMLMKRPNVQGGAGGNGGAGGHGGVGGSGGAGGSSFFTIDTYTNSNGSTREVFITNPGGCSGPDGHQGRKGMSGVFGNVGQDGSYQIEVGDEVYDRRYDLKVVKQIFFDANDDGIYEPNEPLQLKVQVENIGGMPTPIQPIELSLRNSEWVKFDPTSTITIRDVIDAGEKGKPQAKLRFQVGSNVLLSREPFKAEGLIGFQALLSRVNKEFSTVAKQVVNFLVRYPVEISKVVGSTTIALGQQAPLLFSLKNISSKELGSASLSKRVVSIAFRVVGEFAGQVLFTDKDEKDHPGADGIQLSYPHLFSKDVQLILSSLRFISPVPPYSKVRLAASLYLTNPYLNDPKIGGIPGGASEDFERERPLEVIQQEVFEVQYADRYVKEPKADFLLVTNSGTGADEINAWNALAKTLHLVMSVWNVSLYNGISIHQKLLGGSLLEDFKGKTIVILNQPFENGEHETVLPLGMMPNNEIYLAARDHGIKTYVIGQEAALCHLLPSLDEITSRASTSIDRHYTDRSKISREKFRLKVVKQSEILRKTDPTKEHLIVHDFAIQTLTTTCTGANYHLGAYKTVDGLSLSQSSFLQVTLPEERIHEPDFIQSNQNVYALLKELPFTRKLNAILNIPENHSLLLKQAILSDLADEHFLFSQDNWTGEWTKKKLHDNLRNLNELVAWHRENHSLLQAPTFSMNLIVHFKAFVEHLPHWWDYLAPNRRQRLLKTVTNEILESLLTNILKLKKKDWEPTYRTFKSRISEMDRTELFKKMRNPVNLTNFSQNNWSPFPRIFSKADVTTSLEVERKSTVIEEMNQFNTAEDKKIAFENLKRKLPDYEEEEKKE